MLLDVFWGQSHLVKSRVVESLSYPSVSQLGGVNHYCCHMMNTLTQLSRRNINISKSVCCFCVVINAYVVHLNESMCDWSAWEASEGSVSSPRRSFRVEKMITTRRWQSCASNGRRTTRNSRHSHWRKRGEDFISFRIEDHYIEVIFCCLWLLTSFWCCSFADKK